MTIVKFAPRSVIIRSSPVARRVMLVAPGTNHPGELGRAVSFFTEQFLRALIIGWYPA